MEAKDRLGFPEDIGEKSLMVNEVWGVVTETALWGWMVAVIIFIWKAFAPGAFLAKAWRWGVLLVMMYTIWICGMLNA